MTFSGLRQANLERHISGRVAAASLPGFQELVGASARPVEDIVEMSIIADDGEGTACDVALPVLSEFSQGWLMEVLFGGCIGGGFVL
jgi:hypothetical protein